MPPVLPDSLARLLSLLRGGFTAPTFDTFCWLVHGFIGRVGEHTITGVWQAARLGGVLHHSRAHDFFASRRWSPDRLGLSLCDFVVTCFIDQDATIAVAVDDTLFTRTGRKVFAAAWLFEQAAPKSCTTPKMGFGNSFVCLGILVRLPGSERTICLPLLFRLWRVAAGGATKVDLAHELIEMFAARFPRRRVELVADSYYATRKLATLPTNVTAWVSVRSNSAFWAQHRNRRGAIAAGRASEGNGSALFASSSHPPTCAGSSSDSSATAENSSPTCSRSTASGSKCSTINRSVW